MGIAGLIQPFADALKLLLKSNRKYFFYNPLLFLISPILCIIIGLLYWNLIFLRKDHVHQSNKQLLFVLILRGLFVYVLILAGWSSNSKYALIGTYRRVAQTVSYEISIRFFIVFFGLYTRRYKLFFLKNIKIYFICTFWGFMLILIIWIVIILAEIGRPPLDLMERERELVSGYNVEYGGFLFTFLFIREYRVLLFISYLRAVLFFQNEILTVFMLAIFIIFRAFLVRIRYDRLIYFCWKKILPFIILIIIVLFNIIIILNSF